jgi:Proto-chlorophyllide reductase 57 kD subunit
MKFLCVPCDSPMQLQTVGPPDRGSLSVVYSCPECGYEIAMLTNAYETQVVQSLGVRIGPSTELGARPAEASAEGGKSGSGCPFSAMIPTVEGALHSSGVRSAPAGAERGEGAPASDGAGGSGGAKPPGLGWTAAAEARLANIPEFVRPMARTGIEKFARDRGALEVDEEILDAARDFFGM